MDMQTIIVSIIVVLALAYMGKRVYASMSGQTGCASCKGGQGAAKGGCPGCGQGPKEKL